MSKTGLWGTGLSVTQRLNQRGVMHIVEDVSQASGVPITILLGRSRAKSVALARKELYVRLRTEQSLSYPEIGYLLDRDHTTVMFACHSAGL